MTNDGVDKVEQFLHNAESNLESAARLLYNETDTGSEIYQSIKLICNSISDIFNRTYQLRDFD